MIYTARWIFPATSPPLERGTITVAGDRIESVDPHGVRTPDVDLGNAAIIPGLVNAHTHLDLSGARGKIPPTDPEHFTDWLMGVIEYRKTRTPEQVKQDIDEGLKECLSTGTTTVGDIAGAGLSWNSLKESALRANVYFEFLGLTQDRAKHSYISLLQWLGSRKDEERIHAMVSPHAAYSVRNEYFRSMARNGMGLAIHFAESRAELQLLREHDGPFRRFLESLGLWEPEAIAESQDWILWRTRRSPSVLLIHCNYLQHDVDIGNNQSVIYCPRTHAAFKHSRHPFAEFLAGGANVALGTDSLASNPDLDLFEEARFVYRHRKDVSPETILKMATINGAKALGFDTVCGSLEPGKSADFVVMPLGNAAGDPHDLLFNTPSGERRTLFRGEWRK